MEKEYQYRVILNEKDETGTAGSNPNRAGDQYRLMKKIMPPNSTVELQRREIGEWQTVEKENN